MCIIKILKKDEVFEYQREFLHLNLADIVSAKFVAIYLTSIAEEKYKSVIPVAFSNIFKIIGVFMDNETVCENSQKCVVNKIMNNKWKYTDICNQCADIMEGYDNVLQIKDDLYEA